MPASLLQFAVIAVAQFSSEPALMPLQPMQPAEAAVLDRQDRSVLVGPPLPVPPDATQAPQAAPAAASAQPIRYANPEQPAAGGSPQREPGSVAPAQRLTPLVPLQSIASEGSATALLETSLEPPLEGALSGRPMTLLEALERADTSTQQVQVVKSYWRLSQAVARYHFTVEESAFLASVSSGGEPQDAAVLTARRAAADAAQISAHMEAVRAQHELANVTLQTVVQWLPLPADSPFAGRYLTRFETLLGSQPTPARLLQIDQSLPHLRQWIGALTTATSAAAEARSTLLEAYRRGQTPLTELLEAHRQLIDQRRTFLSAVLNYNDEIADYALSVAAPGETRETIVSMLIPSGAASSTVAATASAAQAPPTQLQPAALLQPVDASSPFRDVTPRR